MEDQSSDGRPARASPPPPLPKRTSSRKNLSKKVPKSPLPERKGRRKSANLCKPINDMIAARRNSFPEDKTDRPKQRIPSPLRVKATSILTSSIPENSVGVKLSSSPIAEENKETIDLQQELKTIKASKEKLEKKYKELEDEVCEAGELKELVQKLRGERDTLYSTSCSYEEKLEKLENELMKVKAENLKFHENEVKMKKLEKENKELKERENKELAEKENKELAEKESKDMGDSENNEKIIALETQLKESELKRKALEDELAKFESEKTSAIATWAAEADRIRVESEKKTKELRKEIKSMEGEKMAAIATWVAEADKLRKDLKSAEKEVKRYKASPTKLRRSSSESQIDGTGAWAKKAYHKKKNSRLKFPNEKEIKSLKEKKTTKKGEQPFAKLVYQWHLVQCQIDAGIHMAKRAKKFMSRMATLHEKFASEVKKAAAEEKAKVLKHKPVDRMNSCRDSFMMILMQCTQMAKTHTTFAERIHSAVLTPLAKFYQVGGELAETTQQSKEDNARSLERCFVELRKSEVQTQHMIDLLLRQASKVRKTIQNPSARRGLFGSRIKKEDVEKLQVKTIAATQQHAILCQRASEHQQRYLQNEMPTVLEEMQVIEEMRIESFRQQMVRYSEIVEQFADNYLRVAEDINFFGNAIKNKEDIKNFAVNCKFEGDDHLSLPQVRYALSKNAEELKGDIITEGEGVFNRTYQSIMNLQKTTRPALEIPFLIVDLSEAVEDLGGFQTEGIFRVPAASHEVQQLKALMEKKDFKIPSDMSPHVPASLLKEYLRTKRDSLIPTEFYDKCVEMGKSLDKVPGVEFAQVLDKIPKINRMIIVHLVELVSIISAPRNVVKNRMTLANLSMVFAPSILRNPSTDPLKMIENIKNEVSFVQKLFQYVVHKALPKKNRQSLINLLQSGPMPTPE